MIKTIQMLRDELNTYNNPDAKVKRMVMAGELTPIVRGIYETDNTIPGHYIAESVYGPSYLSFEFALSYYGLIPETVYNFTCATFEKKRSKEYRTPFGTYTYRDIPSKAYPYEVKVIFEQGYTYKIASAEKAVCDMLYKVSPLGNRKGLIEYLFDDLRIYEDGFYNLNMGIIQELCGLYKTQNHRLMKGFVRRVVH